MAGEPTFGLTLLLLLVLVVEGHSKETSFLFEEEIADSLIEPSDLNNRPSPSWGPWIRTGVYELFASASRFLGWPSPDGPPQRNFGANCTGSRGGYCGKDTSCCWDSANCMQDGSSAGSPPECCPNEMCHVQSGSSLNTCCPSYAPICNGPQHTCVECLTNGQCHGDHHRCGPQSECVECLDQDDCLYGWSCRDNRCHQPDLPTTSPPSCADTDCDAEGCTTNGWRDDCYDETYCGDDTNICTSAGGGGGGLECSGGDPDKDGNRCDSHFCYCNCNNGGVCTPTCLNNLGVDCVNGPGIDPQLCQGTCDCTDCWSGKLCDTVAGVCPAIQVLELAALRINHTKADADQYESVLQHNWLKTAADLRALSATGREALMQTIPIPLVQSAYTLLDQQ